MLENDARSSLSSQKLSNRFSSQDLKNIAIIPEQKCDFGGHSQSNGREFGLIGIELSKENKFKQSDVDGLKKAHLKKIKTSRVRLDFGGFGLLNFQFLSRKKGVNIFT